MVTIPFIEAPDVTQEIILDGTAFRFTFVFNERGGFWAMSILTPDNVEIITGIKLVLNYELIDMYHHLAIPPGQLFVFDSDPNSLEKIAFEDFTNDRNLELIYVTESEVESAVS